LSEFTTKSYKIQEDTSDTYTPCLKKRPTFGLL